MNLSKGFKEFFDMSSYEGAVTRLWVVSILAAINVIGVIVAVINLIRIFG